MGAVVFDVHPVAVTVIVLPICPIFTLSAPPEFSIGFVQTNPLTARQLPAPDGADKLKIPRVKKIPNTTAIMRIDQP